MTISMTSSLLKHCAYAESISVSLLKKTVIDVNWNCNFFGCFLSTFVLSLRRSSQIRPSFCLCQLPACILSVFYSLDSCSLRASLCFWTCSSPVSSVWADWRVTVPAAEGQPETQSWALQQTLREESLPGLSLIILLASAGAGVGFVIASLQLDIHHTNIYQGCSR